MESRFSTSIARLAWLIPAGLLALTIHQSKVTRDLGATLRDGEPAMAEVLRYERSDRKDVTHAEIDLRVVLADGSILTRRRLALPYSIAHRVDSADSVAVHVLPNAGQDVVIDGIVGTQRRIALSNAVMSLVAFLMAFVGVLAWNRSAQRRTDTEEPTGQSA